MSSTLEAVRRPVAMERPASSERWRWLRLLFRRKIALIGAILVTINVIVAVLAPAIGRWDPLLLDVKAPPPGAERDALVRHRRRGAGRVEPGDLRRRGCR